jgi:hypothetical protein
MMQLGDKRAGSNAENRRDFGTMMGILGIAGVAISAFAYFLGIAPGDLLNIAAQIGVQR